MACLFCSFNHTQHTHTHTHSHTHQHRETQIRLLVICLRHQTQTAVSLSAMWLGHQTSLWILLLSPLLCKSGRSGDVVNNDVLFAIPVKVVSWTGVEGDSYVESEEHLQISSQSDPLQQTHDFCSQYHLPSYMCSQLIDIMEQKMTREAILQHNNEVFISGLESLTRQERSSSTTPTDTPDHHDNNNHDKYSSFSCISGNQEFKEDWKANNRGNTSFLQHRVCIVNNVCYDGYNFKYFQHPEEAAAPTHLQLMQSPELLLLNLHGRPYTFSVVQEAVSDYSMDPHTWFLSHATIAFNYAHLLKVNYHNHNGVAILTALPSMAYHTPYTIYHIYIHLISYTVYLISQTHRPPSHRELHIYHPPLSVHVG